MKRYCEKQQFLCCFFFAFCFLYIVDSDLGINIYIHCQWCQLHTRKENLHRLFQEMQDYQFNKIQESGDQPLDDDTRILQAEDIDRYQLLITDIAPKVPAQANIVHF